jgi:hypothetical protein
MTNNRIYVFVYRLFNDVAITLLNMNYNDKIISEVIRPDVEASGHDLILCCRSMKNIIQENLAFCGPPFEPGIFRVGISTSHLRDTSCRNEEEGEEEEKEGGEEQKWKRRRRK